MYLMGLVNSTFVARRPTDHVELVDLSEEKKKAQDRYNKEQKALTNGTQSPKPSASPRRHALENHPADLVMEPLFPLFLTSTSSSDSSDGDTPTGDTPIGDTETKPCQLQETAANMVERTENSEKTEKVLEDASSMQRELDQEFSRGEKMKQADQTMTQSKTRVAPKLGRMVSDGGVSTRVRRHPLEMIQEQEHSDEHIVRAKIDRPSRVLQHPLERLDEDSPKSRKPATKKERKPAGEVAASQPPGRKFVRESKLEVKPPPKRDMKPPPKRERAKPREIRAPITKPRNPKPVCEIPPEANDREKPSLASPVMEKMQGLVAASPEHSPSWNQKFQNLPKLAVSSVDTEPLMEERELRYSSPKMTESDVQDELSFRVWERESTPKRKSISVSSDFQDLDLETLGSQSIANPKTESTENVKQIPEQLSPLRTSREREIPKPLDVQTRNCEDEIQHEYPSPSSFTCGLSPTSLFSDDDNIFSRFQQFPDFGDATTTFTTSPRSVLSQQQQPDEISHFASDSSETQHRHQASSSTYNDESSDLESTAGLNERSFATFTYTDKEMDFTTSEDEAQCNTILADDENAHSINGAELQYFQEANHREPWLEKDGGVLDDTDLQFLLPIETSTAIPDDSEISEESPSRTPKCQNSWTPCDDVTRGPAARLRRHSRSSSFSKSNEKRVSKRSVKFAPELVREIPNPNPNPKSSPKSIQLPRPESRDDDEQIYPSVKSWEVKDDVDAASPSSPAARRRWRSALNAKPQESPQCDDAGASVMSSRRRWRRCRGEKNGEHVGSGRERGVAQIMPCAGRLFSWPQRLAFKVSRSRRAVEESDDDESVAESFGRSARRDAQQVRRILKGSQKRFSNLTVADILKDNFQS